MERAGEPTPEREGQCAAWNLGPGPAHASVLEVPLGGSMAWLCTAEQMPGPAAERDAIRREHTRIAREEAMELVLGEAPIQPAGESDAAGMQNHPSARDQDTGAHRGRGR